MPLESFTILSPSLFDLINLSLQKQFLFIMTTQPILKPKNSKHSSAEINSLSLSVSLQHRLDRLNIPLDDSLTKAIAQYHSSQVTAALNHVETNYELIKSPKAVFLYQLPKQPIEENQPLLPIYTASDFPGYTLKHMKAWYPRNWKQAAIHFGISLE